MFYTLNTFIIEIKILGSDWSDLNPNLRNQLRQALRWVARTRSENHAFIRHVSIEVITAYDSATYRRAGHFWPWGEWAKHHQGWEDLIQGLVLSGHNNRRISVCLFANEWKNQQDETDFESAFKVMGVDEVKTDTRIHKEICTCK